MTRAPSPNLKSGRGMDRGRVPILVSLPCATRCHRSPTHPLPARGVPTVQATSIEPHPNFTSGTTHILRLSTTNDWRTRSVLHERLATQVVAAMCSGSFRHSCLFPMPTRTWPCWYPALYCSRNQDMVRVNVLLRFLIARTTRRQANPYLDCKATHLTQCMSDLPCKIAKQ